MPVQTEFYQRRHRQPAWPLLVIACLAIGSTFGIAQSRCVQNTTSLIFHVAKTVPQQAAALQQKLLASPSLKNLCIDLTSDCILYFASEPRGTTPPVFRSNCKTLTETIAHDSAGFYLPNLSRLPLPVAHQLGGCSGIVDLSGLTSIDTHIAKALAGEQKLLCLNGLTSITPEVAQCLARTCGTLQLNGLTTINPEVAAALAKHKGTLALNSLQTIPPKAARFLSRHRGDISLNALRSLSVESAEAFSHFTSGLHINGVINMTERAASLLAKHPGWQLGCRSLCQTTNHNNVLMILQQHNRSGFVFSQAVKKIGSSVL